MLQKASYFVLSVGHDFPGLGVYLYQLCDPLGLNRSLSFYTQLPPLCTAIRNCLGLNMRVSFGKTALNLERPSEKGVLEPSPFISSHLSDVQLELRMFVSIKGM